MIRNMILMNKSNQKYTLFNETIHICECATVQSGRPRLTAHTGVNLCKIIFPKYKTNIILLMTIVIENANLYFNLKIEDFWFRHLCTDQDSCTFT